MFIIYIIYLISVCIYTTHKNLNFILGHHTMVGKCQRHVQGFRHMWKGGETFIEEGILGESLTGQCGRSKSEGK